MHRNEILYALICINNHVLSYIISMLSSLHVKMTVSQVEKTTSKSILEIGKNIKSSLSMDLLGHMHKLDKET